MFDGNKCGKCQNHDYEVFKKGHARDCPFKRCECLKCRLLDARSDILQVISGKETKLKGTKKDPNCGFCQNHCVKIMRKGHVRSCGFGQERHFKFENCFDCEVHYIRNEVNRLQIKMRRAMKEDRTLSEEQRKTAREAITRDEVEKVCEMARSARKKRETLLSAQQVGESSMLRHNDYDHDHNHQASAMRHTSDGSSSSCCAQQASSSRFAMAQTMVQQQQKQQFVAGAQMENEEEATKFVDNNKLNRSIELRQQHLSQSLGGLMSCSQTRGEQQPANVWRPWSQTAPPTQTAPIISGDLIQAMDIEQGNEMQQQQQQLFNVILGLFFARIADSAHLLPASQPPPTNGEHH